MADFVTEVRAFKQPVWKARLLALPLTKEQKGKALAELVKLKPDDREAVLDADPELAIPAVKQLIGDWAPDPANRRCLHGLATTVAGPPRAWPADTSSDFARAYLTPLPHGTSVATHRCALERPLGRRLPVYPALRLSLVLEDASLDHMVASEDEEPEGGTAYTIQTWFSQVIERPFEGGFVLHEIAVLVSDTLTLLGQYFPELQLTMDFARPADATAERLCPDFCCWSEGALVFKGEIRSNNAQLQDAVSNLGRKMSVAWDPEMLPGVPLPPMLAFAAAGSLLQFFAIRSAETGESVVTEISGVFNLWERGARVRALRTVCNVFRVLRAMAEHLPRIPLAMGRELVVRGDDGDIRRTVQVFKGFIRKCIFKFAERHEAAGVKDLRAIQRAYAATAGVPGVIQAHGDPGLDWDGTYTVHLAPVGLPYHHAPVAESERKAAVRAVLVGLCALHANGLVHRDIRWPNVLRTAPGGWLLIDLEHAAEAGQQCPPGLAHCQAPGTLDAEGCFTPASDLVMVAQQLLLLPSGMQLGKSAQDLVEKLQRRELSAADALQHEWFSAP